MSGPSDCHRKLTVDFRGLPRLKFWVEGWIERIIRARFCCDWPEFWRIPAISELQLDEPIVGSTPRDKPCVINFMSDHQRVFLGCIADDVTGATDLAINLVKGGMRVVQFLSTPSAAQLEGLNCDAVVVALKTRSVTADQAIRDSLAAVEVLKSCGCQRFYFKYCSTFDSTPEGNIGPVAAAIMQRLDAEKTIVCPAFPAAGRTVYLGHLFVNGKLLNESGMQNHPLNPMTDSDIVRFLGRQTALSVGRVETPHIAAGSDSTANAIDRAVSEGDQLLVTDTCCDTDLATIAEAVVDHVFITGGSGIARYLPDAWRREGLIAKTIHSPELRPIKGKTLIIAGSCSEVTQRQVAYMKDRSVCVRVDVEALMQDFDALVDKFESVVPNVDDRPLMIYSTAEAHEIEPLHKKYGRTEVCRTVENFHGHVARRLVRAFGFGKIIVAGGETAGAVMRDLEVSRLQIGPEICTGVPWTFTSGKLDIAIALKSGNFGGEDFFESASTMLVLQ